MVAIEKNDTLTGAVTWINLSNSVRRDKSQAPEATDGMTPFIGPVQSGHILKGRVSIGGCLGLMWRELKDAGFLFGVMESSGTG